MGGNMSAEKREIVLIPEKPLLSEAYVNSHNFANFLVGGRYFPYKSWRFDDYLDLDGLTSSIQDLYNTSNVVNVFPDDLQISMEEFRQQMESHAQSIDNSTSIEKNPQIEGKTHGEKASVIYFDFSDRSIKMSRIIGGGNSEVPIGPLLSEVLKEDNMPVLEMHTQPTHGLPSPIDYRRLLAKGFFEESRFVNGIIVLGPNEQILAVPTPNTPLLSFEEVDDVIGKYDQEYENIVKPIAEKYHKRGTRIQEAFSNDMRRVVDVSDTDEQAKSMKEFTAQMYHLTQMIIMGGISLIDEDIEGSEIINQVEKPTYVN